MADTYKDVFESTRSALREAGTGALSTFETESRQVAGLKSAVTTRGFAFEVDEPKALGGTDEAPNPVEYLLAALGTCQEITYRLYADALGIPLRGVAVKVSGDVDLRGLFDADDGVRPGFRGIRATVKLDSPASKADLERLKAAVDAHCPVLDTLRNVTPVSIGIEQGGRGHAVAAE